LYNVVPLLNLPPDLCLELADIPEVVAVKQSNDNFHELADLLRLARGRLTVLTAIEDLLFPSLLLGAPGMMVAIAAVLPELCVELYRAVERGDLELARQLHERILPVVRAVLVDENFPAPLKTALALRGRPEDRPAARSSPRRRTRKRRSAAACRKPAFSRGRLVSSRPPDRI
ncbi:MAG: dihydrodipicolinate synthase family protein, partial [Thermoanaerobaculia bacterium]